LGTHQTTQHKDTRALKADTVFTFYASAAQFIKNNKETVARKEKWTFVTADQWADLSN
jgi:hypothetical protein